MVRFVSAIGRWGSVWLGRAERRCRRCDFGCADGAPSGALTVRLGESMLLTMGLRFTAIASIRFVDSVSGIGFVSRREIVGETTLGLECVSFGSVPEIGFDARKVLRAGNRSEPGEGSEQGQGTAASMATGRWVAHNGAEQVRSVIESGGFLDKIIEKSGGRSHKFPRWPPIRRGLG